MKKKIHIHVGPHKTGTTAFQHFIEINSDEIRSKLQIEVVERSYYRDASLLLCKKEWDAATDQLQGAKQFIQESSASEFLISSEDFSGDMLGRSNTRKPYPKLWENLRTIQKAFSNFHCLFYFVEREEQSWLKSTYHQNLRFRTRFRSFDAFSEFVLADDLWADITSKAKAKLADDFVVLQYSKNVVEDLCLAIFQGQDFKGKNVGRCNVSLPTEVNRLFENINSGNGSMNAKVKAKSCILNDSGSPKLKEVNCFFPEWGQRAQIDCPDDVPKELQKLWERVAKRVSTENQNDLLPDEDCDLSPYLDRIVEDVPNIPEMGRGVMENQWEILRYRFQSQPEICFLLGLTISYLRRSTEHTEKARVIFQRLWSEHGPFLLSTLSTRWLISSFQTFLEHGVNENQRLIGGSAFFFTNILKAYETERSLEGLPTDGIYKYDEPAVDPGFSGLDRFALGGTDLLLNTNALLLETATKDPVAGPVLIEFMLRSKNSKSVFSRMDNSRKEKNITRPGFIDCWSFNEKPN